MLFRYKLIHLKILEIDTKKAMACVIWYAILVMIKVKLDLITNVDMYLFFENRSKECYLLYFYKIQKSEQ